MLEALSFRDWNSAGDALASGDVFASPKNALRAFSKESSIGSDRFGLIFVLSDRFVFSRLICYVLLTRGDIFAAQRHLREFHEPLLFHFAHLVGDTPHVVIPTEAPLSRRGICFSLSSSSAPAIAKVFKTVQTSFSPNY